MFDKLFETLQGQQVITVGKEEFKKAFTTDTEYQKKVFDYISAPGREWFTEDYETFINTYLPIEREVVKEEDSVVTDATALSQDGTASKSGEASSDGRLVFGDQRSKRQKLKDYEYRMRKIFSGQDPMTKEMTEQEKIEWASKYPVPPGSPSDQHIRYYNVWRQQFDESDPESILEPLNIDTESIESSFNTRLDEISKDFQVSMPDASKEDLIREVDVIVDDIIHQHPYLSQDFLPYVENKYKDQFESDARAEYERLIKEGLDEYEAEEQAISIAQKKYEDVFMEELK